MGNRLKRELYSKYRYTYRSTVSGSCMMQMIKWLERNIEPYNPSSFRKYYIVKTRALYTSRTSRWVGKTLVYDVNTISINIEIFFRDKSDCLMFKLNF